ncbi:MAG: hypothetical protein PUC29_01730, partial [Clostridia bacterium]|nr:hypothetical protein [Clostridia bacterium]
MNFRELLKLHIVKRLPAVITAVLLTAVIGLYYVGAYDVSFIERPESWKNNFTLLKEIFNKEKDPPLPAEPAPDEETTAPDNTEYPPTITGHDKTDKESLAQVITFKTVAELKAEGYTLSSKVWDSSCVMGKLVCDYAWPKAFSYGEKTFDEEKFTYYDDGT